MKKQIFFALVFALTNGSLVAQTLVKVVDNENDLKGQKINSDIKFVNKAADDVEISRFTSLKAFRFEGNFATPKGPKELTVRACDFYTSQFFGPYFQTITFDSCHFQKSPIFKSSIDTVDAFIVGADFRDCTFSDGLDFSNTTIGKNGLSIAGEMSGQLDLSQLKIEGPLARIDLLKLYPRKYNGDKSDTISKIEIDLTDAPIANILMDYSHFKLEPSSLRSELNATSIYTALLANFKTRGYDESYELADIDFQKYKNHHSKSCLGKMFLPCIDKFQEIWWKYGYDKYRILFITPVLLLLFTIVNLFFYKSMNKLVYTVNDDEMATQNVNFYNSLVYTAVIFFSFTLKLENLHFKSRSLAIWLIVVYLFGVICMGFLANYVLKDGVLS